MRPAEVRVHTTLAEMDALAGSWAALAPGSKGPMCQFEWMRAYAEDLPEGEALRIVTVGGGDDVIGIAPLVSTGGAGGVELLSGRELDEPTDLVYRDASGLHALAETLARLKSRLHLARIPADSPTVAALRSAFGRGAIFVTRDAGSAPAIELGTTWLEPESTFNSRRRADFRRARRRAEELGSVRTEVLSPSLDEVGPLIEQAFRVEAAGWKTGAGTALLHDARMGGFIRRWAAAEAAQGTLRLCFLWIGDRVAAMQIAAELGERFWLLKIGYDEDFSRCSPGTLLMLDSVRYAAEQGCTWYELLGTPAAWTRVWPTSERPTVSVQAYPFSPRALGALVADGAIIARRRIIRPLAARAARTYVAGPELADAVATCRSFGDRGIASTVSYWDGERDSPRSVADQCLAAIGELAESGLDCYLSIKAPALGYSSDLVSQIVERAAAANIGVHFDSLAPDTAGPTFDLIAELGGARLGCTLPGRWRRSREDAAWAVEHGLGVRIVKGQWPDPEGHDLDDRAGFLAVVDQLTKAPRVAVATHDLRLAREALQRLRTAGTACELELMHRLANRHVDGVPLRVYVPYGSPSLPYSIQRAMRQPRLAWRLLRDQVSGSALTARP